MKPRQNWLVLVVFLFVISLFLVACERPLPGGYNDPDAGPDSTAPDVPVDVPEVDSGEAYPAEQEPAAPGDAEPAAPAEGYPAEGEAVDQGLTAEEEPAAEETAPQTDQPEAVDTEAPAAEETTGEAETPAEEAEEVEETADTPGTHTVIAGENLYRISLLYGINWVDLAEANGISDPAGLAVGQVLIIPIGDEEAEAEAVEEDTEEAEVVEEEGEPETDTADTTQEESGEPGTYIVQPGDTLNIIGTALGVDWAEIVALNDIVGTQIFAGQVLIVPNPAGAATEPQADEATAEETSYVVQEGDSIYSVAFEHSIPWTALVEANSIEAPYTLELGQTLIIPAGE